MALGITEAVELSGRVIRLLKDGVTMELQDVKEEVLALREENSELKRAVTKRETFKFDGEMYWVEEAGAEREGPFCQKCHDTHSRSVRLQKAQPASGVSWMCNVCGFMYGRLNPR